MCYTCHKEQRVQMSKPSHHPVPEGKMKCSDCHNVHGSIGPKLAKRDSTNDTCFTCHAEKRGPFVHQHEPVVEDCSNCHNPHGSTVAAMLTTRPPVLCQQCHTPHVAGEVGALGGQPGVFTQPGPGQNPAVMATVERQERGQPVAGAQLHELPHPGARIEQSVRDEPDAAVPVPLREGAKR